MEVKLRKYPKVFNIPDERIKNILDGEVEITEKVDGSQFRILLTPDGFDCGSKNVAGTSNIDKSMFETAIEQAERIWQLYKMYFEDDIIALYCEFLREPRHNTLQYNRIPKNHLYLFGALINNEPVKTDDLIEFAETFEIEPPEVMYRGTVQNEKELLQFLDRESVLGGTKIEGIVIKNYNQTYPVDITSVSNYYGFPLVGKIVSKDFREVNATVWNDRKLSLIERLLKKYVTEKRLKKVLQHLNEQGLYHGRKEDLKIIVPAFFRDLMEEEKENIQKDILKEMMKDFDRRAKKRLVKIYLLMLMKN